MTKQVDRDLKIVGHARENMINGFKNELKTIKQYLDNINYKDRPDLTDLNLSSLKGYMEFLNIKYDLE